jgi:mannosyl-3-phosphoglycerate phosphatase
MRKTIIFTDLDGTLLDAESYSFDPALPALQRLKLADIPLVFVTSKTRAEVEYWRRRILGNHHPFIVENGGAAFIPQDYFPFHVDGIARDGYIVLEWGIRYHRLVDVLEKAALESQCPVRGFHNLTVYEIAELCNMPVDMAKLAKTREYDEPFQILDSSHAQDLETIIAREGLRCTHGGRFGHIIGPNDKAKAVSQLAGIFERAFGHITSIGLGDAINDASFLSLVDIAIIMPSPFASEILKLVPNATVARFPGPRGWNDAIVSATAESP